MEVFNDSLNKTLMILSTKNHHIKIAGHFDVDFMKFSKQCHSLQDLLFSCDCCPKTHDVTRVPPNGGSCMDNIHTNVVPSEYPALVLNSLL